MLEVVVDPDGVTVTVEVVLAVSEPVPLLEALTVADLDSVTEPV